MVMMRALVFISLFAVIASKYLRQELVKNVFLLRQSTYKCITYQDDTISADPANRAIEVASETELRYAPILNFGLALNLQRPVG